VRSRNEQGDVEFRAWRMSPAGLMPQQPPRLVMYQRWVGKRESPTDPATIGRAFKGGDGDDESAPSSGGSVSGFRARVAGTAFFSDSPET